MANIIFIGSEGEHTLIHSDIIPRKGDQVSIFKKGYTHNVKNVVINYDGEFSKKFGTTAKIDVIVTVSLFD